MFNPDSVVPAGVLTRRAALRAAATLGIGAAALTALPGAASAEQRPAPRRIGTPDEALKELRDGNRRFVEGHATAPHRSLDRVHEVVARQAPFAAILACADSRVPVELLFDQGFGDLFVCRAAGNIASPEMIASLEFGIEELGASALVVLGHTGCGAVTAAASGKAVPGQISALFSYIRPAITRAHGDVRGAVTENARIQADLLAGASPVLAHRIEEGKLQVVSAVYDLGTGAVTFLPS